MWPCSRRPRPAPRRLAPHHLGRREQHRRVEVALQGLAGSDPPCAPRPSASASRPRRHRRRPRPSGRAAHRCRHRSGSAGRRSGRPREDLGGVRQHGAPVVGAGQRADPRVEELHGRGAGLDLHLRKAAEIRRACAAARATFPGRRTSAPWCARGPSTGRPPRGRTPGERRTGEPDQRRGAEFGDQQPHGLGDERDVLRRRGRASRRGRRASGSGWR